MTTNVPIVQDEGRILADDGVALVAEHLSGQLDALIAARNDNGGIIEAVSVSHRLTDVPNGLLSFGYDAAQRLVAVGGAVLQGGGGVVFEYIGGKPCQIGYREGLWGGISGGQRDGVRILGGLQNFTDR